METKCNPLRLEILGFELLTQMIASSMAYPEAVYPAIIHYVSVITMSNPSLDRV